jgi:hypothetical protein
MLASEQNRSRVTHERRDQLLPPYRCQIQQIVHPALRQTLKQAVLEWHRTGGNPFVAVRSRWLDPTSE